MTNKPIIMDESDCHTAELTRLRQANAELLSVLESVSRLDYLQEHNALALKVKLAIDKHTPKPTRAMGREIMKQIEQKMAATTLTNSD